MEDNMIEPKWGDNPFADSLRVIFMVLASPLLLPGWLARAALWLRGVIAERSRPKPVEFVTPLVESRSNWDALADDDQRAVFAALIRIGRPAKNIELAEIMGCSAAESSKRVTALNGLLVKERVGREVRVSLPRPN